jgi:hypothetical protein
MGPQADRLLRILVARETPVTEYSVDVLAQVAADDGPASPVRVELEKGPSGWSFRRGPALVAPATDDVRYPTRRATRRRKA